jgi:hypothetical protein
VHPQIRVGVNEWQRCLDEVQRTPEGSGEIPWGREVSDGFLKDDVESGAGDFGPAGGEGVTKLGEENL